MWYTNFQQNPYVGAWYARAQRRPSWVWQIALAAAALVVIVPIVVLTLAALFVAAAVFTVLSLVAAGVGFVRSLLGGAGVHHVPADDGRRNVRVIHRP